MKVIRACYGRRTGGGRSTRVTGNFVVVSSKVCWSHENRETNRKTVKVCSSRWCFDGDGTATADVADAEIDGDLEIGRHAGSLMTWRSGRLEVWRCLPQEI